MTETTADIERQKVHILPFVVALIAAPVVTGLPAWALLWPIIHFDLEVVAPMLLLAIVAAAPIVGAPVYLLFGAPAVFLALRKGGAHAGVVFPAMVANMLAAPAFLIAYLVLEGADGGAILSTLFYTLLGFPFAVVWALIFSHVYNALIERFDYE